MFFSSAHAIVSLAVSLVPKNEFDPTLFMLEAIEERCEEAFIQGLISERERQLDIINGMGTRYRERRGQTGEEAGQREEGRAERGGQGRGV